MADQRFQIAAPPVIDGPAAPGVFLYALDEHQHIRRGGFERRGGHFSSGIPIGGGIAHSPGGGPMGLVPQIDADEMRQASIAPGHEGQIGEPL